MSRAQKLTDDRIARLPMARGGSRYDVPDGGTPNLFVRVGARQKSFVLLARFGRAKNSSRRVIGVFGKMELDEAQAIASAWNDLIDLGIDPKEEKEREAEEEERKAEEEALVLRHTFASVMEDYIAVLPNREMNKHVPQDIDLIRRDIVNPERNPWLQQPISRVRAHHVSSLVKAIRDRGAETVALTVFRRFKTFFNWLMDPDLQLAYGMDPDNPRNPIRDLMAKTLGLHDRERDRVLHRDEILAYWRAACAMPYPFGPFYRALLLTGVRKSELLGMRWCEIHWEEMLWIVPKERFKANTEHLVPLSWPMLELLREIRDSLPEFHGEFVFSTTNGQRPVAVNKKMDAFRALVTREHAGIRPGIVMERFVLHDDRRVIRSNLAALKVKEVVIDTIQGHGKKGMKRIYDQYRYLADTSEALDLWADWLCRLAAGTAPNAADGPRCPLPDATKPAGKQP